MAEPFAGRGALGDLPVNQHQQKCRDDPDMGRDMYLSDAPLSEVSVEGISLDAADIEASVSNGVGPVHSLDQPAMAGLGRVLSTLPHWESSKLNVGFE
jgi:hypothetical protein